MPQPNLLDPKRVRLVADNDGNGRPSAGDVLEYSIAITNTGKADATGVTFQDNLGSTISVVPGSVSTTLGTILSGNSAGDTTISVDIGTIAAGEEAVITFRVTINPLPEGVCEVVNQSTLTGDNFSIVRSDDVNTSAPNDATTINVCEAPTPVPDTPTVTATSSELIPVTGADLSGNNLNTVQTALFGLGLLFLGAAVVIDSSGVKALSDLDLEDEKDEEDEKDQD